MPLYFSSVAPTCPVSRDQAISPDSRYWPGGPGSAGITNRTTIPHSFDLPSALAAANIAKNIVNQMSFDYVRNNVYPAKPIQPPSAAKDKVSDLRRRPRWKEVTGQRVKRKYKYYETDKNGVKNKSVWVMTERIERMVWYDSSWKVYLIWEYGDKGEGEPTGPATGANGSPIGGGE